MNGECEEEVSSQSLGRGPNKSETTSSANIHTVLYYGMDTFKTQYKCKILNGFFFKTNPTEFKSQCLDFTTMHRIMFSDDWTKKCDCRTPQLIRQNL